MFDENDTININIYPIILPNPIEIDVYPIYSSLYFLIPHSFTKLPFLVL